VPRVGAEIVRQPHLIHFDNKTTHQLQLLIYLKVTLDEKYLSAWLGLRGSEAARLRAVVSFVKSLEHTTKESFNSRQRRVVRIWGQRVSVVIFRIISCIIEANVERGVWVSGSGCACEVAQVKVILKAKTLVLPHKVASQ
jgi:hypothetical protein